MSKAVYLAGPLDGLDVDGTTWYDEFARFCSEDMVGYMPGRAFINAAGYPAGMDKMNRAALLECGWTLANLSGPGRALGTIREIEFASAHNRKVIVVGDISKSLASHDLMTAESVEDAISQIDYYYRL